MNNKTDRKSDWQREFDERIKGWVVDGTIEGYQVEVLKHFISNLLSKQREQKKGETKRRAYQMGYKDGMQKAREQVVEEMLRHGVRCNNKYCYPEGNKCKLINKLNKLGDGVWKK